jgi:hypothetical protein
MQFRQIISKNDEIYGCLLLGSGKTHTMMGTPEHPGLILRVCMAIQQRIVGECNESTSFRMDVSYYEVFILLTTF